MSAHGCTHLSQFKLSKGANTFKIIHAFFVACIAKDARKRKFHDCYCHTCCSKSLRLHACLHCVYFGCYNARHIHEHAQATKHYLAVDVTYGTVYCFICGDYVYDQDLEDISRKQKKKAARDLGIYVFHPWEPSCTEIELLNKHPKRKRLTNKSYLGLRGLINIGSTCFMNCIIQALTHTPLLRDFFLADRHTCQFIDDPAMCLVCEMSRLFQEFYSGKVTPHVPNHMLYLVWNHANHLAGYEQHDAHEFFIATLDVLHRHCIESNDVSNNKHCNCIIDQIFTGQLQSDVICQKCKTVSTTYDPFWDISLDLGTSSQNSHSTGVADRTVENAEKISLLDCLERFTRPEDLGSNGKIECSSCQSYQESVKQLTMKQLPIVASFHLKRFEVTSSSNKKITTFISFPQCLDMTPFISSYRSTTFSNNTNGDYADLNTSDNKYYLFAVVEHHGNLELGHYISYVRQHRDQWFKCNDELITKTTVEKVLQTQGYLLFYHKQILEYESAASS